MEYLAILNIAFFASLSHCVGMCGGIVLALNQKIIQTKQNAVWANFLYNFGRLGSYCVIGAICGGIGLTFTITPFIKSIVFIGIGFLITLMAIFFLFAPKFLIFLEPDVQKRGFFSLIFKNLFFSSSYKSFYFLGILNGFLPCGIVYYFALVALASGGIGEGIKTMLLFGLCTMIPMLSVGILSGFILKIKLYQDQIHKICAFFMLLFGLYTLYKGIKGL